VTRAFALDHRRVRAFKGALPLYLHLHAVADFRTGKGTICLQEYARETGDAPRTVSLHRALLAQIGEVGFRAVKVHGQNSHLAFEITNYHSYYTQLDAPDQVQRDAGSTPEAPVYLQQDAVRGGDYLQQDAHGHMQQDARYTPRTTPPLTTTPVSSVAAHSVSTSESVREEAAPAPTAPRAVPGETLALFPELSVAPTPIRGKRSARPATAAPPLADDAAALWAVLERRGPAYHRAVRRTVRAERLGELVALGVTPQALDVAADATGDVWHAINLARATARRAQGTAPRRPTVVHNFPERGATVEEQIAQYGGEEGNAEAEAIAARWRARQSADQFGF